MRCSAGLVMRHCAVRVKRGNGCKTGADKIRLARARGSQLFIDAQLGEDVRAQRLFNQAKNAHNAAPSCSIAIRMCAASDAVLRDFSSVDGLTASMMRA